MENEINKITKFFNNTAIGDSIFNKMLTFKVIDVTDDTGWCSIKYKVKVEVTERKIKGFGYIKDGETYEWVEYDQSNNKTYIATYEISPELTFVQWMNNYGGKIEVKIR